MNDFHEHIQSVTRRHFFRKGATGLGVAALASLVPTKTIATDIAKGIGGLPELPHFAPKAKRAIYLFLNGGPSQQDMWDYKPKMVELFNKDLPDSIRKGQRLTTMTSGQTRFPVAPSKYKFQQYGKSGTWLR